MPDPDDTHLLDAWRSRRDQDAFARPARRRTRYERGDVGLAAHPDPITGQLFASEATATGFRLVAPRRDGKEAVTVGSRQVASSPPSDF